MGEHVAEGELEQLSEDCLKHCHAWRNRPSNRSLEKALLVHGPARLFQGYNPSHLSRNERHYYNYLSMIHMRNQVKKKKFNR